MIKKHFLLPSILIFLSVVGFFLNGRYSIVIIDLVCISLFLIGLITLIKALKT